MGIACSTGTTASACSTATLSACSSALTRPRARFRGMIMASEIGDRTFLITAVMAMKHPRMTVWREPAVMLHCCNALCARKT